MNTTVLLFGAGKSATVLIERLLEMSAVNDWHLVVADSNLALAQSKIGGSPHGSALPLQVHDEAARRKAIADANLVISLLPPSLHFPVAEDCIAEGKDLLTASYVDEKVASLSDAARSKGLIFLCEMGLDPGIDHMSGLDLIEKVKGRGGEITGFASHCGGLVAPESDDNPWHYKVSWNPANVVAAGSAGATLKSDGQLKRLTYEEIFSTEKLLLFPELGVWQCYPNRDSTTYISQYGLENAENFVRTTIRHPRFMKGWSAIVQAGLTRNEPLPTATSSFSEWSKPVEPFVSSDNRELLEYLGLFSREPIPVNATSSSLVMQYLLETHLAMKPDDRDMVLMLHQVEYVLNGKKRIAESSMEFSGLNANYTAMATTVGLPLAYATELILLHRPAVSGIVLPFARQIYQAVLPQLQQEGIVFEETDKAINN